MKLCACSVCYQENSLPYLKIGKVARKHFVKLWSIQAVICEFPSSERSDTGHVTFKLLSEHGFTFAVKV